MTEEQRHYLANLDVALRDATRSGLLDIISDWLGPDCVNKFCDAVRETLEEDR